jgi:hypothetical protein
MRFACLVGSLLVCFPFSASADSQLDALLAAYPDKLASYTDSELVAEIAHAAGDTRANSRSPNCWTAPIFATSSPFLPACNGAVPGTGEGCGPRRIRNEAFFLKMYGDCRRGEVTPNLKAISWLPNHGGGTVRATAEQGVADRLEKVSRELDSLPAPMIQYLVPISGIYNCRPIAETNRLSMHAFGAAIDINARFGNYWLWSKRLDGEIVWRNQIPEKIVEIFERHGFIWGGRWYHFDSLHFEYRPELIALAKQGWPGN